MDIAGKCNKNSSGRTEFVGIQIKGNNKNVN
jgi:hypothetical protein